MDVSLVTKNRGGDVKLAQRAMDTETFEPCASGRANTGGLGRDVDVKLYSWFKDSCVGD